MSKTQQEAADLTEYFRHLTTSIKDKLISLINDNSNQEINCLLPSANPFLNNTIIKHLFGYLSLEDIKESRLVCHQWNSTAEICLRKRSAIHFRQNVLMPDTFIEVSKYSHPDLPFPSFVFSNNEKSRWLISDIQGFLKKWEKNIKEVTVDCVTLARKVKTNKRVLIRKYDVAQLFINPSNITSLKIKTSEDYEPITQWEISLEKFVSIKTLSLSQCRIIVPAENQITRIAPLSIDFDKVTVIQNEEIPPNSQYSDLVDFSKALNIRLYRDYILHEITDPIFDMTNQVFNLNQLHLGSVPLGNWAQAKGEVQFLRLYDTPFVEKNYLKIKVLEFTNSNIDLAVLPETLEALKLDASFEAEEIICSQSLKLPNLKFLAIDVKDRHILTYFSQCRNLVDLLILRNRNAKIDLYEFSLGSIPKSVKNIAMNLLPIKFTDDCTLELDTFALEWDTVEMGLGTQDIIAIATKFKSKVLIVGFDYEFSVDTSNIVQLVPAIKQSQKFLIGSLYSGMHLVTPFEGSTWSKYVDKKSNFYEFENEVGKAITQEEFQRYDFEDYIPDNFHSRSK